MVNLLYRDTFIHAHIYTDIYNFVQFTDLLSSCKVALQMEIWWKMMFLHCVTTF